MAANRPRAQAANEVYRLPPPLFDAREFALALLA